MRDIALVILIGGLLPFIFRRPFLGVLMWTWIGIMNPHRLTYGFAQELPIAMVVGLITIIAFLGTRENKRLPMNATTILLLLWIFWMTVTTIFSLVPDGAWLQWQKVMKIQLMTVLTLILLKGQRRINMLVWVATLSIIFFGVKGGLFTVLNGGQFMVLGPSGSFIEGNTEVSLAIVMMLPLLYYMRSQVSLEQKRLRLVLLGCMVLSAFAIVGSYSRGALLAGLAMAAFLWLKGENKLKVGVILLLFVPFLLIFMPDKWSNKMNTIQTYEQDESAMGRINAWYFAANLAADYPVTGGGFDSFQPGLFMKYAPNPEDFHDAHSIYFKALGEQGYVGLLLFCSLWICMWRDASWVIKESQKNAKMSWASNLARMIQVCLIGYLVGGAFLGLTYFDVPYLLLIIVVALRTRYQELCTEAASSQLVTYQKALEPIVVTVPRRTSLR